MAMIRIGLIWVLSFFYVQGSMAAVDPVAWSLQPISGFSPVGPGGASTVVYTLSNNLPFTTTINTTFIKSHEWFYIQDNCNGYPLFPGTSCLIAITFFPQGVGTSFIQLTYGYHLNRIPLPPLLAVANGPTPPSSCSVVGSNPLPLPVNTYQFADNLVKFVFTNPCSNAPAILGPVNLNVSFSAGIQAVVNNSQAVVTTGSDTCSNQTLPPQGSCSILASIVPQNPAANMVVSASVTSGGQVATASTSSRVNSNNPSTHVVHFVNQCPFNVWYGIANGSGGSNSPDPTPGSQPNGAPASSYLLPAQLPGQAPSVINLVVPEYINGAIWPRTGCAFQGSSFVCETGNCTSLPDSGTCVTSGIPNTTPQPIPPFTKFEFTINSAGADGVYDVSLINGFNVPVEIKGLGPTSSDPFSCTGAGAVIQPQGSTLGSCSWQFNPGDPNVSGLDPLNVVWVSAGPPDNCTSNSSCAGGLVCGMAFDNILAPNTINRRCGEFIGYTTLANYIGYSSASQWGSSTFNLYNQYGMGNLLGASYGQFPITPPPTPANANFGNMLGCQITTTDALDSCYNNANTNLANCCGCVDWDTSPIPTAVAASCLNKNPDWTTNLIGTITAQKAIMWLKKTCPTAYSYQFDDQSSSFTCTPPGLVSYQITFCPGGITSLPTGAVDGRLS
ncbi:thaumatin family protein [Legionella maceachernii]|uniref:Thaumatin domain-containing protein n=1 Tax=Legionella maceachernii TaxID=466 RepID=A0A0W0WDU3_9GAMM|nr:thaumatin family protein [Legionella maceachernii]KTD30523.1 Thaumatin domain-containing protein [Legionella maceachernii]SJZ65895.1 Thaumatin family protein [Legionella maceachernii]SUP01931.1 Thaumatin family [Legionella maceachernii]